MNITVKFKDVYGNRLVYPVCDNAQHFASIAGTKTLSDSVIKTIISMDTTSRWRPKN